MKRYLGGGRVLDLGPASATHSRGRVPGGVMVSQAVLPAIGGLHARPSIVERDRERRQRKRETLARFKAAHSDCTCHVIYGGQPRPVRT